MALAVGIAILDKYQIAVLLVHSAFGYSGDIMEEIATSMS